MFCYKILVIHAIPSAAVQERSPCSFPALAEEQTGLERAVEIEPT